MPRNADAAPEPSRPPQAAAPRAGQAATTPKPPEALFAALLGGGTLAVTRRRSAERLIDAAIELVAEHGTRRLSPGEVAARAGLSRTAARHHYPDRTALLAGVTERLADIDPISSDPPPGERPDSYARLEGEYRSFVARDPAGFRARLQLRQAVATTHPELAPPLREHERRVADAVAHRLGALTATDPGEWSSCAMTLVAAWLGIEAGHLIDQDDALRDRAYAATAGGLRHLRPASQADAA